MSKSYKGEARAQARIAQARREARHSKIECRDNFLKCAQAKALFKKTVVDASPVTERGWTAVRQR